MAFGSTGSFQIPLGRGCAVLLSGEIWVSCCGSSLGSGCDIRKSLRGAILC